MKIGLKILRDKVAYLTNFQYIYIQLKASNINNKTFIIEYAKNWWFHFRSLLCDTQLRERRIAHVLHPRSSSADSRQPLQHVDTKSSRAGAAPAGNRTEPHRQVLHTCPSTFDRQCFRGALGLPFPLSHCFAPSTRISQRLSSEKLFFPPQTSTKLSEPPYTLMACCIFVEPILKKGVFLSIGNVMNYFTIYSL